MTGEASTTGSNITNVKLLCVITADETLGRRRFELIKPTKTWLESYFTSVLTQAPTRSTEYIFFYALFGT